MRPITANSLTTADVRSRSGEDLGKIVDFMLDTAALDAADGIDRTNPPQSADATLRKPGTSAASHAASHGQGQNYG